MKKLYATRDFTDAGTGKAFVSGAELTGLTAGELGNYEHAGLAGPEVKSADKPTDGSKASDKPA